MTPLAPVLFSTMTFCDQSFCQMAGNQTRRYVRGARRRKRKERSDVCFGLDSPRPMSPPGERRSLKRQATNPAIISYSVSPTGVDHRSQQQRYGEPYFMRLQRGKDFLREPAYLVHVHVMRHHAPVERHEDRNCRPEDPPLLRQS